MIVLALTNSTSRFVCTLPLTLSNQWNITAFRVHSGTGAHRNSEIVKCKQAKRCQRSFIRLLWQHEALTHGFLWKGCHWLAYQLKNLCWLILWTLTEVNSSPTHNVFSIGCERIVLSHVSDYRGYPRRYATWKTYFMDSLGKCERSHM